MTKEHITGMPFMVFTTKEKPKEDILFDNLKITASPNYLWSGGNINRNGRVDLMFENKYITGTLFLSEEKARSLFEALRKIYDVDKKGIVKKTYSMVKI